MAQRAVPDRREANGLDRRDGRAHDRSPDSPSDVRSESAASSSDTGRIMRAGEMAQHQVVGETVERNAGGQLAREGAQQGQLGPGGQPGEGPRIVTDQSGTTTNNSTGSSGSGTGSGNETSGGKSGSTSGTDSTPVKGGQDGSAGSGSARGDCCNSGGDGTSTDNFEGGRNALASLAASFNDAVLLGGKTAATKGGAAAAGGVTRTGGAGPGMGMGCLQARASAEKAEAAREAASLPEVAGAGSKSTPLSARHRVDHSGPSLRGEEVGGKPPPGRVHG